MSDDNPLNLPPDELAELKRQMAEAHRTGDYGGRHASELRADMAEQLLRRDRAKLAKAMEALRKIGDGHVLGAWVARTVLSELEDK